MDSRFGGFIGDVMTDDEILLMAEAWNTMIDRKRCVSDAELIVFARAIESRTWTATKARWYQIGREAERHDIAKMVENYCGAWDDEGQALIQMIKARGE